MSKVAFFTSAALVAIVSTPALCADLPASKGPPAPPPAPVFSWTGFYLGGNAGFAFDARTNFRTADGTGTANAVPAFRPAYAQTNTNGFSGGLQIGYNYELADVLHLGGNGGLVLGVEADAAYTDLDKTGDFVTGGRDNFLGSRLEFLGTARGRIGYAFDRALLYGTGGFAYGDLDRHANFETGPVSAFTGAQSSFATGVVYGGGVEYALETTSYLNVFHSSAVTVKGEFLHYELGNSALSVQSTGRAVGPGAYTTRVHTDGDIVRAGLNFKFGAPVVPVVARY